MWKVFSTTMLKPFLERVGTAAGMYVLLAGDKVCEAWAQSCGLVTQAGVGMVMSWLVAAAFFAMDWSIGQLNRKTEERKTIARFISPRMPR